MLTPQNAPVCQGPTGAHRGPPGPEAQNKEKEESNAISNKWCPVVKGVK